MKDYNKKTRILFSISFELKAKLEELAKKSNRSVSNYIVNLIIKDIESHK